MAKDKDDPQGGGFTGKRNKSWREIDAQRGKSKYHSRQDDPTQQRIERSASYTRYKAAADALFTGGELPDAQCRQPGDREPACHAVSYAVDRRQRRHGAALASNQLRQPGLVWRLHQHRLA